MLNLLQVVSVTREHNHKEQGARAGQQRAAQDHAARARVFGDAHVQAGEHQCCEGEHDRRQQLGHAIFGPVLRDEAAEQHVEHRKQADADDALARLVRGRLAAALRAEVHDDEDRQHRAHERVLELRGVRGAGEQREEQHRGLERVQRLVQLHAPAAEELRVPHRVAREVAAGLHAEPGVRRAERAERKRHDEQQPVDLRRRHVHVVRQRPAQGLRVRVPVREGARVEGHVHEVDCPEAGTSAERVRERAHQYKDDGLTHAEGQQRRQQPASQQLLLRVVKAACARSAVLPQLHAMLQALEYLLAEEQRDHKHDHGHDVVVFKTQLHIHAVVY